MPWFQRLWPLRPPSLSPVNSPASLCCTIFSQALSFPIKIQWLELEPGVIRAQAAQAGRPENPEVGMQVGVLPSPGSRQLPSLLCVCSHPGSPWAAAVGWDLEAWSNFSITPWSRLAGDKWASRAG